MNIRIVEKKCDIEEIHKLIALGIDPFLAKIYNARGVKHIKEIDLNINDLYHFSHFYNIEPAVSRIILAMNHNEKIVIVGDYDADGATATAVVIRAFRLLGFFNIDYLVPNRFQEGYGISNTIVDQALSLGASLIITVDNGISAVSTISYAQEKGIEIIVTDHHLAQEILPNCLIINPNQLSCSFQSKNIAGVGVAFYLMLALRNQLVLNHYFEKNNIIKPNFASLLDLVALGTMADVVKLDFNNRILIHQGLKRIRTGKMCCGVRALFQVARKKYEKAVASDLSFFIAPRINAAGRLGDIRTSIECLLADDEEKAFFYANQLNALNMKRKSIEKKMSEEALSLIEENDTLTKMKNQYSICLYKEDWNEGVVGIVAGRLKEKYYRPTIIFAPKSDNTLTGSCRSIPSIHLVEVLSDIQRKDPQLIVKFGGHALAAGVTIALDNFDKFQQVFENAVKNYLSDKDFTKHYITDGELEEQEINLPNAEKIANLVWGEGFEFPAFSGIFEVIEEKQVGLNHKKVILKKGKSNFEAMFFKTTVALPQKINTIYKLVANEWNHQKELQLYVDYWEKA